MSSSAVVPASNFETNSRRSRDVAETRTSRGRARRDTAGRYDGQKTRLLATGLGRPVPSVNVRTAVANVVDPFGNGLGRIQASVNRNVDILELERSHRRISEGAYLTGRIIQTAFEKLGGTRTANWQGSNKSDAKTISDVIAVNSIESAREITALMGRIVARIGMIDARLIRRILGDRMTFAQCADQQGKAGERGTSYVAMRFRDSLEDLTEAWTAKGMKAAAADDKHEAAAGAAIERQRTSMSAGVTAARRQEEAKAALAQAARERHANPGRKG